MQSDTYTLNGAEIRSLVWSLARLAAQLAALVDQLELQLARAERG